MSIIPPEAPFNPDQKAVLNNLLPSLTADQSMWLRGFLAAKSGGAAPAGAPKAQPLTILYGTESGNCEELAARAKKAAQKKGFKPVIKDMGDIEPNALKGIENLLIIVSTWGEGDPPERAADFYEKIMADGAPELKGTRFSVCGLGDTSYDDFCKMGKDFDARLEALGAERIASRADCDVDFDATYESWFTAAIKELGSGVEMAGASAPVASLAPSVEWSKSNPFKANLNERVVLNGTGSNKETIHVELSLEGSGIQYQPGDALGVKPSNCTEMVDDLLAATGFNADETVELAGKDKAKLREALTHDLDITAVSRKVVQAYAELAPNEKLKSLMDDSKALKEYLFGREIIDLIKDYPSKDITAQQFVGILRPIPPRLYSIASSLSAHPDEVHLTVGAVRYETNGRKRKGVASTYLADRVAVDETVPVYIHQNNKFRLPENSDTPIIMVGPGTGVAPFRAFVEERAATDAKGESWLFFGEQQFSYDFYYQLEWLDYLKDGALTKLDVAFSRDAPEKVYVQQRMKENGKELFQWLEKGAHFYVCGDASRMAKDVDQALIDIVAEEGKMDAKAAKQYVKAMQKEKRYQKDVY